MLAVQPKPDGLNSSIVTLSASPGSAPSMKIGPVTGLTLAKSSVADVGDACSSAEIWPPRGVDALELDASSPGATVRTGGIAWSHPKW